MAGVPVVDLLLQLPISPGGRGANATCIASTASPGAFCYYCRSSCHKDQHVIQIRRSSYHDVVRAAKIDTVLDISETFRVSIAFSLLNNLA
ncbi:hypothetical protein NL676_007354 [Syzygium grande]|nr:hypothetical protein NL676_007354 [Syzygium grande]